MNARFCAMVLCGLAAVLAAGHPRHAAAAEGDLDPGFGYYHDGTAFLPIEDRLPGQFSDDHAVAILPQTDGSTIVVGNINRSSRHGAPTSFENIGIAKLRPEGTYEYAFGNGGGWLILPGSGVAGSEIHAWSATQDLSGRIAIAGFRTLSGARSMAVWMITPDGVLDTTFGSGGVLTINRGIAGSLDEARSIRTPTLKDVVATTFASGFTVAGSLRDSAGATSATALFPITANGGFYSSGRGTHAITAGPNSGARYTRMPVPASFASCDSTAAAQAYRSLNTASFVWYVVEISAAPTAVAGCRRPGLAHSTSRLPATARPETAARSLPSTRPCQPGRKPCRYRSMASAALRSSARRCKPIWSRLRTWRSPC